MRIIAAAFAACAVLAVAGCGSDTEAATTITDSAPITSASSSSATTTATTTPTAAVATPPAAATAKQTQACQDALPYFDQLRSTFGQDYLDGQVQNMLDWFPTRPEWAGLSEAERAATLNGVRDAAKGSCS